jgi:tetratricopeptide (TPR) repeat protein
MLVFALSPVAPPAEGLDRLIGEAEGLLERGDPEKAVEVLRPGLAGGAGGDLRAWTLYAEAARAASDYETAGPAYARLFALGGGREQAVLAASAFLEAKNVEAAEEALSRCPEEGDPALRARIDELRGTCLYLRGREEEARPLLERARAGGQSSAAHLLGLIRFHRGEYPEAADLLAEAVQAAPEDYYSRLYRGWALLELNRLEESRTALLETRSVAATPEVEEMLGRLELRAGRLEPALARFRAALAAQPRYAEAEFGAAAALRRLGRESEAREAAARFRELHDDEQAGLREAYRLQQEQLASPRDPARFDAQAAHYLRAGDLEEAERCAFRSLGLDPTRSGPRLLLARALNASGRFREAALHYRKVLRAEPGHREARAELEELIRKHARPRRDG